MYRFAITGCFVQVFSTRSKASITPPGIFRNNFDLKTTGIKSGKNIIRLFLENPASRRLKMQKSKAFTLIELLVVIAIIALLLSILIPSLSMAKDHAKKIGCLANLRSLVIAAGFYADHNDGLTPSSTNSWSGGAGWCGDTGTGGSLSIEMQIIELYKGQLWPYIETIKAWRCPTDSNKEQLRSYCMAAQWWGTYTLDDNSVSYDSGTTGLVCRKISDIKNPAQRFIFVDGAGMNHDAYFALWYSEPMWWNIPQYKHGGGSVNGYADGHVEAYKMDAETVKMAAEADDVATSWYQMPQDDLPDSEDLKYYQRATWGKLGW
jgi:prepilin-type N-terminal cleavage/methylation domain-containing protein/prepilin-type processing-associated H-X9-DG protein